MLHTDIKNLDDAFKTHFLHNANFFDWCHEKDLIFIFTEDGEVLEPEEDRETNEEYEMVYELDEDEVPEKI